MRCIVKQIILVSLLLFGEGAYGFDFEQGGLYFEILNDNEVQVVSPYVNSSDWIKGEVVIPDNVICGNKSYTVVSIGEGAFSYCGELKTIEIPSSVVSIGRGAFAFCSMLVSANFPSEVNVIEEAVFQECMSLKNFLLPEQVTYIGNYAFYNCRSLESMKIPDMVSEIGEYAFGWCLYMKEIYLGASVTKIDEYAFLNCLNLNKITCSMMNPPQCDLNIFECFDTSNNIYDNTSIIVPKQSLENYCNTSPWKFFNNKVTMDEVGIHTVIYDYERSDGIYDFGGMRIKMNKNSTDINFLPSGIYIINGKKVYIK